MRSRTELYDLILPVCHSFYLDAASTGYSINIVLYNIKRHGSAAQDGEMKRPRGPGWVGSHCEVRSALCTGLVGQIRTANGKHSTVCTLTIDEPHVIARAGPLWIVCQ